MVFPGKEEFQRRNQHGMQVYFLCFYKIVLTTFLFFTQVQGICTCKGKHSLIWRIIFTCTLYVELN